MNKQETRKITIPNEQEKMTIEEIVLYFERERKEVIRNMEGLMVFAFIMEKIGPYIYNQAVIDTQKYMSDKIEDLYGLMF